MVNIFVQVNTIFHLIQMSFDESVGLHTVINLMLWIPKQCFPPWRCISLSSSLQQSWMNPKAKRSKHWISAGKVRVSERCVPSTSFSSCPNLLSLTRSWLCCGSCRRTSVHLSEAMKLFFPPSSSRSLCTALAVFLAVATDHHEPWCQF